VTQPVFGVTPTGFQAETQQDLVQDETADLLATIANDLDVSPVVPLGQVVGIDAEKNAELWELAGFAFTSTNPGSAEGFLLDNIGAIRGIPRQPATYSAVWCAIAMTQPGTYPAGALVGYVDGLTGQTAANLAAVVVPATNTYGPVTATNPYVFGSDYAPAVLFQAPLTGPNFAQALIGANAGFATSGSIGAFAGQLPVTGWASPTALSGTASVASGSTSVTFSAPQTLSRGIPLTFDTSGAVYFLAAAITASTSATLTVAYAGTTNATATATFLGLADLSTAQNGAGVEQDTPYRVRQQQELGAQGSCNLAAIAVDVIEALSEAPSTVNASCTPFENTSDYFDANGLPPHSYQVIVYDGQQPNTAQNNPLIGQAIWNNKPAGLRPYGTTQVTVVDSQGVQRTVTFTRPTPVYPYMTVNVTIASGANPAQVKALIDQALVAASQGAQFTVYGMTLVPTVNAPTSLLPGTDVVPQAFSGIAQGQAGVVQVLSVLVGFAPNPTQETVLETPRGSIAVLKQANIQVNVSVFVP
jgi:hypothetical protein